MLYKGDQLNLLCTYILRIKMSDSASNLNIKSQLLKRKLDYLMAQYKLFIKYHIG